MSEVLLDVIRHWDVLRRSQCPSELREGIHAQQVYPLSADREVRIPVPLQPPFATRDNSGLHVAYLFLDDEPAEVALRLRPRLEQRWSSTDIEPLLAAPFHSLAAYEWDRYLP